jgi:hypothetical protein
VLRRSLDPKARHRHVPSRGRRLQLTRTSGYREWPFGASLSRVRQQCASPVIVGAAPPLTGDDTSPHRMWSMVCPPVCSGIRMYGHIARGHNPAGRPSRTRRCQRCRVTFPWRSRDPQPGGHH